MLKCQSQPSILTKPVTNKERLITVLQNVPDDFLQKILDFAQYLQWKRQPEAREAALLSQAALAQDWLSEAEDEAWQDL
jgi:hypothetical protein